MGLWNGEAGPSDARSAKPDFTGENYLECFVLYLSLSKRDEESEKGVCRHRR